MRATPFLKQSPLLTQFALQLPKDALAFPEASLDGLDIGPPGGTMPAGGADAAGVVFGCAARRAVP